MLLYRIMSNYELKKLMGIDVSNLHKGTLKGENTFKYAPNTEYVHFFRYAEHAKNRISQFGVIIAKFDIPEELIDQFGYGFYNTQAPLPECIVKKENFDIKFLKEFSYELTLGWCLPNVKEENRYYCTYQDLYNELVEYLGNKYKKSKECKHISFATYFLNNMKDKDIEEVLLSHLKDAEKTLKKKRRSRW